MKKFGKVVLGSMLALGGLLSNVAVSPVKAQEEYDLVVWEDVYKSNGITAAVEQFEAEHGVNILVIEKTYAQQLEDLRLDGPAGSGPDVFTMPADQIGTAVVEGLVKARNPCLGRNRAGVQTFKRPCCCDYRYKRKNDYHNFSGKTDEKLL